MVGFAQEMVKSNGFGWKFRVSRHRRLKDEGSPHGKIIPRALEVVATDGQDMLRIWV